MRHPVARLSCRPKRPAPPKGAHDRLKSLLTIPRNTCSRCSEIRAHDPAKRAHYLRRLFVLGAISIVRTARTRPDKYPWVTELLGRRPTKVVAVALANKMARVAWAVLARGEA